jgi:hypothetical protein
VDADWFKLLTAALGGGFVVKLLDIMYQEVRRRSDRAQSGKRFVDEHLDPLLKTADEMVGKLRSLADEDFKSIHDVNPANPHVEGIANLDFGSLLFLLVRLWANIEIIRQEGLAVSIVKDVRGQRLQSFMDCIESRRVRIVDRISQRATAELMLTRRDRKLETIGFIEFIKLIETDTEAQRWIAPVIHSLSRTRHTAERQRILQYGAVIHAMIDTLDPDHHASRNRPSYPNKLSKKSRRDLKYRVFGQYLKFVPNTQKYLGPPKRRP